MREDSSLYTNLDLVLVHWHLLAVVSCRDLVFVEK
jgi:hypothetical protein